MKKKISKALYILLIIIFIVIFYLALYLKNKFSSITTEQILYSLLYSEGTGFEAIENGLIYVLTRTIITLIIILIIKKLISKLKYSVLINIKINKKKKSFEVFKLNFLRKTIILLFLIFISLFSMFKALKIDEYIKLQNTSSKIFEDYYVDPNEVSISMPDEKQNLIYIYVESLESTYASSDNGGYYETSLIPNLEKLALENDSFSNKNELGGARKATGTNWTAAALIAQTSAIPLKVNINGNNYRGYGESLPGAYSLGEVLKSYGYNNYFLLGSDANFGGRKDYFESHGNYKIMDYYYAIDEGWIDSDYHEWWGYEDKKLFNFAKKELSNVAKEDKPFNFTILTADTHFDEGYIDDSCPTLFDEHYSNSIYCSDIMIYDFINWIIKQDFYKNTTIIISGDHLTMQSTLNNTIDDNYIRTVYNVIINSKATKGNNKNRVYTIFDMYPTTLAALGATIEGNRLGLGTNLYSDKKTLPEEIGLDYLNEELDKKSFYYDNAILKDTYYKMLEEQN